MRPRSRSVTRPSRWALGLALFACGPEARTTESATSTSGPSTGATDDTAATGTSEPTGTASAASTEATTAGPDTTGPDTTGPELTGTVTTAPPTTSHGCENFLPPIEPAALAPVALGAPFEVTFTVPGLEENTTWTLMGDLPPGVAFTVETGLLAGTPEQAGTSSFWLEARPTQDTPGCPTAPTGAMYDLVVTE